MQKFVHDESFNDREEQLEAKIDQLMAENESLTQLQEKVQKEVIELSESTRNTVEKAEQRYFLISRGPL